MTYSPRAGELCCACISHRLPSALVTTTIGPENPRLPAALARECPPQKRGGNGEREHGRSNQSDMTSRALLTWRESAPAITRATDLSPGRSTRFRRCSPSAQTILIAHGATPSAARSASTEHDAAAS